MTDVVVFSILLFKHIFGMGGGGMLRVQTVHSEGSGGDGA